LNRKHLSRAGSALIGVTLLLSALAPAATAAPPKWELGVVQLVTTGVSDGSAQGFDITITNRGPSNISALYLFDDVSDTPVYVSSPRAGCPTAGSQFYCSFGALTKGDSFTVRVAYTVPFATTAGDSVTFEINTTGVVGGANNSHGDSKTSTQTVLIIPASDSDRAGKWTLDSSDSLKNSQAISATNKQATSLDLLGRYLPASIEDGPTVSFTCPKSQCKSKPFGEWSKVSVSGGEVFTTAFKVTITVARSSVPANSAPAKLVVYHVLDDGSVDTISRVCGAAAPVAGDPECRSASFDSAGNLVIEVYVYKNGGFRGAA
jgi:hypothetical protein